MRCPVIDIRHLVLRNAFLITNIMKQTTANISTGHVQTQSRFSSLFCVLFFPLLVARLARRHCEITANVTQECVYTALLYCCETDNVTQLTAAEVSMAHTNVRIQGSYSSVKRQRLLLRYLTTVLQLEGFQTYSERELQKLIRISCGGLFLNCGS